MMSVRAGTVFLIFAAVLCGQNDFSFAEDEDCDHAICENDNEYMGFTMTKKFVSFRWKQDGKECGIAGGYHCGEKSEDSAESDEMVTMKPTTTADENSTATQPPGQDEVTTAATTTILRSTVDKRGAKCMKVSNVNIIGLMTLKRLKLDGTDFKPESSSEISRPNCEVNDDGHIADSMAKADETRAIKASTFMTDIKFSGVIADSNADLRVNFSMVKEDGNYTYDNQTIEVEKGQVRLVFSIMNPIHWFCEGLSCASSVKICFKVYVGRIEQPTSQESTDSKCMHGICKKEAVISSGAKVGIPLLGIKNGERVKIPEDYAEIGVTNCIKIGTLEDTDTYTFHVLLAPSSTEDAQYTKDLEAEDKTNNPGSGTGGGGNTSKVAANRFSPGSLLAMLAFALLLTI